MGWKGATTIAIAIAIAIANSFEGVREEMEACRLLSLGVNEQNEIDLRD